MSKKQLDASDVLKIWTEVQEENEQLKLQNKQYAMMVNTNSDLNDEIYEQLQKTEKTLKRVCEENEQLNNLLNEVYTFRLMYNALLFNEWSKQGKFEVYKSKRHYDGELCFDGEWFVVVAILPTGQITNHYHIKYWDYFQIKEYPQVKDEFDGHTPIDVLNRLKSMVMM